MLLQYISVCTYALAEALGNLGAARKDGVFCGIGDTTNFHGSDVPIPVIVISEYNVF